MTWKKSGKGFIWLLATFAFWNILCLLVRWGWDCYPDNHHWYCNVSKYNWHTLWGVTSLFVPHLHFDACSAALPINGPLWYLRDLSLLTLFCPILYRYAKWIVIACLLCSFLPCLAHLLEPRCGVLLSVNSIASFSLGCYIRSLHQDRQERVLRFYNIYLIALILVGGFILTWSLGGTPYWLCLVKIWGCYQIARAIECQFPNLIKYVHKLVPVVALFFFGHIIIWPYLPLQNTRMVYLYPAIVFGIFALLFYILKRWSPPFLLYLIAHYRR